MRRARFCSECGEETKSRAGFLPYRAYCSQCAPRFRIARLAIVALAVACAGAGFIAGWTAKPREPFYFIGTPVDLASRRSHLQQESEGNRNSAPAAGSKSQSFTPLGEAESLCGAPTKSGRPCRRKVRGGGYCYQHRDKFPPRQSAGDRPTGSQ